MEYGVCGEPGIASQLVEAGYDYIEVHVQRDLKTTESKEAFAPQMKRLSGTPIRIPVANCFVPGDLKITGPEVNREALRGYVQTAFERAESVGIEAIVFGSGGARRVPEGYDRDSAWQELLDFGRMIGPLAQKHAITVVVEPLNRQECNVLNSIGESATYVRQVNHPNVRLLVDAYHWAREQDSYEDLVEAMPLIRHAHIATYASRMAPGLEACDFSLLFRALMEGGYDGRISIEGRWNDLGQEGRIALAELKRAAQEVGL